MVHLLTQFLISIIVLVMLTIVVVMNRVVKVMSENKSSGGHSDHGDS